MGGAETVVVAGCTGLASALPDAFWAASSSRSRSTSEARGSGEPASILGFLNDARAGAAWLHHGVEPDEPNKKDRPTVRKYFNRLGIKVGMELPANRTANADYARCSMACAEPAHFLSRIERPFWFVRW